MRGLLFLATLLAASHGWSQAASHAATELSSISTPSKVEWVIIAKDGRSLVGVCDDDLIRQWSLPQGQLLRSFSGVGPIGQLLVSDDGRWILAGGYNGTVMGWEAATGKRVFESHVSPYVEGGFASVSTNPSAFSHSAKYLAISATGEPVQIVEWPSGKKLYQLESVVGGNTAIVFSPDDSRIASADADGVIRIYDAVSGKVLARNEDFLLEPFAIDFTHDGREIVAAGADKLVVFIEASSGKLLRRLPRFPDPVAYVQVSPDGKLLSVSLGKAESVSLPASFSVWDASSGQKQWEWNPPVVARGATWTSDGHLLAATFGGSAVHLWRVF